MNLKNRMIIEEYRAERPDFVRLGDLVSGMLKQGVRSLGTEVLAVEHRVKEEQSLVGKLERKDEKYRSLGDITDILGARVICFFSDDVDKVAAIIEKMFVIDWENSVDKRAQLDPDAFGYLSLHYICSLPENEGYPKELCGKRFEIQIRSTLQHTWAAINHDLGYKSEFGVPRNIVREFSRLAGLLEIADERFVDIRDNLHRYGDEIRAQIAENRADNVPLDLVSLKEFAAHNKALRAFMEEMAAICGAEIQDINPENYLQQFAWLGKKTLGDLQEMLREDGPLALALARYTLERTDLDILSSNAALRYLCRAELINRGYSEDKIAEFLALTANNPKRALRQAKHLLDVYSKVKGGQA